MLRSATSSACLGLAFAVAARRSRAQLRSLAASVHLHTMASPRLRAMHGILRPVPGRAQDIWLTDALCGCTFDIVHLDNRVLQVRAARARACAA